MSFTHIATRRISTGSETITKTMSNEAGSESNLSESIAANQTNLLVGYTLDVSAVKSFYIVSDVAMTVKTNSSGSPANTLTLVAGQPYLWVVGDYDTFKLTTDVTALYITNTTAGTLDIRALVDATP